MSNEEIKQKILEMYPEDYSESSIGSVLGKIESLDSDLRSDLENLLQNGHVVETEIEGYTLSKLVQEHGMNEVAAILTLDWLKREPEKAKESLKKGHDKVV